MHSGVTELRQLNDILMYILYMPLVFQKILLLEKCKNMKGSVPLQCGCA